MNGFLARITGSAFARDSFVLVSGTAFAQLILFVSMLELSRLYSPAAFGTYAVFISVSSIVAIAVTLRYETAILLPKEEPEAASLVSLGLLSVVGLGGVIALAASLLPFGFRKLVGLAGLSGWLPVAVLAGMATAVVAIAVAWLNRKQAYGRISMLRIVQSTMIAIVAIFLGLGGVADGLLLAQLAALLAVAILALGSLREARAGWHLPSMRSVAGQYSEAPRYLLLTAILDVVTLQLPVLVITARYSSEAAGQFSMAWRILALPMALIGGAVGQVFFQKISADIHTGIRLVWDRYVRLSLWLAAAAVIPTLVMAVYGGDILPFLLGSQWHASGRMAEWLVYSTMLYFVFSPTTSILLVLRRQTVLLIFSLIQLAYRLFAAVIADSAMAYIQWLVAFEIVNVILFEAVVVHVLKAGMRDSPAP